MNISAARLAELKQLRQIVSRAFDHAARQKDVHLMEQTIMLMRDLDRFIDQRMEHIARTGLEFI